MCRTIKWGFVSFSNELHTYLFRPTCQLTYTTRDVCGFHTKSLNHSCDFKYRYGTPRYSCGMSNYAIMLSDIVGPASP